MNLETILNYQRWADRGFVEVLACPRHGHRFLVSVSADGLVLTCPLQDYNKTLGLKEYRDIEAKIKMAEFLFQMK